MRLDRWLLIAACAACACSGSGSSPPPPAPPAPPAAHATCTAPAAIDPGPDPAPVLPALTGHVVDASAFGAIAGDGADDTAAFAAAFAAVANGDRLVIPPGVYDVAFTSPTPSFTLAERSDVEIDATGAVFRLHGYDVTAAANDGGLFTIVASSRIELHGATIEMDRPAYSVGTVSASGSGWVDVDVDPAFPVPDGTKVGTVLDYDPVTHLPSGTYLDEFPATGSFLRATVVAPQRLHIVTPNATAPVGREVVVRHEAYGYQGVVTSNVRDLYLHDLTVTGVPGIAFLVGNGENLFAQRLEVVRPAGVRRLMSSNADGLHIVHMRGTVFVADSTFEGMGDDGLNVHTSFFQVTAVDAATRRITIAGHAGPTDYPLRPGDVLEFRTAALALAGTAVVDAQTVITNGQASTDVVLDAVPAGLAPGTVVVDASLAPSLRVVRTAVRENRARGFLVQTRHALVDSCVFERMTSGGVFVTSDLNAFWEGVPPSDVVVQRSTFHDLNRGTHARPGAISVFGQLADRSVASAPLFSGVELLDDTFDDVPWPGFYVSGADGIVADGTRFRSVAIPPGGRPYQIVSSTNVDVPCYDVE